MTFTATNCWCEHSSLLCCQSQTINPTLRNGNEKVSAIITLIFSAMPLNSVNFKCPSICVRSRCFIQCNYLCQEVMIVSLPKGYACNYLFIMTIPWQKQSVTAAVDCCSGEWIFTIYCINLLVRLREDCIFRITNVFVLMAFAVAWVSVELLRQIEVGKSAEDWNWIRSVVSDRDPKAAWHLTRFICGSASFPCHSPPAMQK